MTELAIDTVRRISTPEGCELELRIAGPVNRVQAWLYDLLIRLAGWMALASLAQLSGDLGTGFFLVSTFLLEWFYPILFEVYMGGQTPGKRACGLVVLHDDGRPIGWNASFIRNTLRFADFLPLMYVAGFITAMLNRDGKRLGDIAAGTVVAYAPTPLKPGRDDARCEETRSEPPPIPLSFEAQQAIIEFHRRNTQLTDARAEELASIPSPLITGLDAEAARRRLLRIGNFLLGR